MKIAFYSPHLGLRGTEVTMYDFAHYNETILGNESIIIYHPNAPQNDESVIKKFNDRFPVHELVGPNYVFNWMADETVPLLDEKLISNKCDAVYMQKGGYNDGVYSRVRKNLILCCALTKEPHGEVYAYISKWLSDFMSDGELPYVPSIVDLPDVEENLRKELEIPENATVYGRTGGMDTWSLPWVSKAIFKSLEKRNDIYFIFQNTPRFINHPRVKYIQSTADMTFKVKFINSCDAMIHSREDGETFGVACGEFSLRNKPIITWKNAQQRSHIEILKEKGIYFENENDVFNILTTFDSAKLPHNNWNCYQEFSPEKVMQKFNEVFLK